MRTLALLEEPYKRTSTLPCDFYMLSHVGSRILRIRDYYGEDREVPHRADLHDGHWRLSEKVLDGGREVWAVPAKCEDGSVVFAVDTGRDEDWMQIDAALNMAEFWGRFAPCD